MPQEKNLGFGQANNIGIKYAMEHDADYIFLLNQDASVHPESIARMLQQSDGLSLITPMQLNGDGTKLDVMFGQIVRKMQNALLDDVLTEKAKANPSYVCGCIAAASWFMPRGLVENIGGFNPLFFHYGEDNNYHHRIVYHGYKTLMVTNAYMYHDRQVHGDIALYSKTKLKRDLLLEFCDINKNAASHIKYIAKTLAKCYAKHLWKRTYIPGQLTINVISILLSYNKILASRKADKKKGMHWL